MTSALKDAVEKNPRIARSIELVYSTTEDELRKDGCSFEGTEKTMDDLIPGCVSVAENIPEPVLGLMDPEPIAILVMTSHKITPEDHKQIYAMIFNVGVPEVGKFIDDCLTNLEAIKE